MPGVPAWDAAGLGPEMAAGPKSLDGVLLARGTGPATGRCAGRQDTVPSDPKDRRRRDFVIARAVHLVVATVFHQLVDNEGGHAPAAAG